MKQEKAITPGHVYNLDMLHFSLFFGKCLLRHSVCCCFKEKVFKDVVLPKSLPHLHTCTLACILIHTYINTQTHTQAYTHIYMHTHVHTYTHAKSLFLFQHFSSTDFLSFSPGLTL